MLLREHRNFLQAQTQHRLYLEQQRPQRLDHLSPCCPIRPPERPDDKRREGGDLCHEERKAAPLIHAHVSLSDVREGMERRDGEQPAEFELEPARVSIEPEVDKSEVGGPGELDSDALSVALVRGLREGGAEEIHVRVELDLQGDRGGAGGRG